MLQVTTKLFGFNDKTKKMSDQRTGGGLHHRDFICIPLIRQLKFCALLFFLMTLLYPCCPKKGDWFSVGFMKGNMQNEWLTITAFLFFFFFFIPDKKIGLCVRLDKTFNWEETLLIAFSEMKCPLNKTICWLNHIISRVINLNHLVLMKFTNVSFIHFSLSVSDQLYVYVHTQKIVYLNA